MPVNKVGMVVSDANYQLGRDMTVSGHVQIALVAAEMLRKRGYSVTIITTKAPDGYVLPGFVHRDITVRSVLPGIYKKWPQKGILWPLLPLFIFRLWKVISGYDMVHFFGTNRAVVLAGLIKTLSFSNVKLAVTLHNFSSPTRKVSKVIVAFFLKRIDYVISLTQYIQKQLLEYGLPGDKIVLMHSGVDDKYSLSKNPAVLKVMPYLLFWRNADWESGADICLEAFKKLSPKYKNLNFIFAVRPGCRYDAEILAAGRTHKNIHLLFFPYHEKIKIEELLSSAEMVILPFRKLSINPQFAVLETMSAGKPLITSNLESNLEIIKNRENGIIIPPNIDSVIGAIEDLLRDVDLATRLGSSARLSIRNEWSWEGYGRELVNIYERLDDDIVA